MPKYTPVFLDEDHPLDPSFPDAKQDLRERLRDEQLDLIREKVYEVMRRSHVTMKEIQAALGYRPSGNYAPIYKLLNCPDKMTSGQVAGFCDITGQPIDWLRCESDLARDQRMLLRLFKDLKNDRHRMKVLSYVIALLELERMEDEVGEALLDADAAVEYWHDQADSFLG